MKIAVRPQDCAYIVKKEDRKIICIYHPPRNIVSQYIMNLCPFIMFYMFETDCGEVELKSYYRGIAVCAEGDEWDEEFGKLVAFNKMRERYYTAVYKRINNFFNWADESLNRAANQFDYMGDKWGKSIDQTEKLIKKHFENKEP